MLEPLNIIWTDGEVEEENPCPCCGRLFYGI